MTDAVAAYLDLAYRAAGGADEEATLDARRGD
jgi:hypothetical protein